MSATSTATRSRHWLLEAARNYEARALGRADWRQAIKQASEIEGLAKALVEALKTPPTAGLSFIRIDAERILADIHKDVQNLEHVAQGSMQSAALISADYVLIGRDLPIIFEILYGRPRRGEAAGAAGRARDRFIAAACEALGWGCPAEGTIRQYRTRYYRDARQWPADANRDWMLAPRGRPDRLEALTAMHERELGRLHERT